MGYSQFQVPLFAHISISKQVVNVNFDQFEFYLKKMWLWCHHLWWKYLTFQPSFCGRTSIKANQSLDQWIDLRIAEKILIGWHFNSFAPFPRFIVQLASYVNVHQWFICYHPKITQRYSGIGNLLLKITKAWLVYSINTVLSEKFLKEYPISIERLLKL